MKFSPCNGRRPRNSRRGPAAIILAAAVSLAAALMAAPAAGATTIERVVSPSGIEAWLVQEHTVPLVALDFAFRGGASQDPADKPGVANMTTSLIDEGAGDLDSKAFHERIAAKAIELSFSANRDQTSGAMRTLSAHLDEAAELVRLSLTEAHFDTVDMDRIREQIMSGLRRETTSPNEMATQRWWATAFPGHAYGRPVRGTLELGPHHHLGRPQGLRPADIRPRHPEDRDRRRHRSRRRRAGWSTRYSADCRPRARSSPCRG